MAVKPLLGESNLMQMYGTFDGFLLELVNKLKPNNVFPISKHSWETEKLPNLQRTPPGLSRLEPENDGFQIRNLLFQGLRKSGEPS